MKNPNIPEGYQTLMPYLILKNASQFLEFTKNIFGASEKMKHLNEDNSIMHAEIQIGDSTVMFAQAGEQWTEQPAGLFIYVNNVDETYIRALEAGATSILEPREQDYGKSGGIKDPCGNTWWITQALEIKK